MYVQKSRYFIVSNNAVTSVLTVVFTYYSFLWSYNQGLRRLPLYLYRDRPFTPHPSPLTPHRLLFKYTVLRIAWIAAWRPAAPGQST